MPFCIKAVFVNIENKVPNRTNPFKCWDSFCKHCVYKKFKSGTRQKNICPAGLGRESDDDFQWFFESNLPNYTSAIQFRKHLIHKINWLCSNRIVSRWGCVCVCVCVCVRVRAYVGLYVCVCVYVLNWDVNLHLF